MNDFRRTFIVHCASAITVGTAGCLSGEDDTNRASSGVTTTQSKTTTTTQRTTESARASEAKERALAAEEKYIGSVLQHTSCVVDWGTAEVVAEKTARVVDRSSGSVYVEVSHRIRTIRRIEPMQTHTRMPRIA